MTSKAKARGGQIVQATFLFDREADEGVPMVAKIDSPAARSPRSAKVKTTSVVQPPAKSFKPEPAGARKATRKRTAEAVAPVEPVNEQPKADVKEPRQRGKPRPSGAVNAVEVPQPNISITHSGERVETRGETPRKPRSRDAAKAAHEHAAASAEKAAVAPEVIADATTPTHQKPGRTEKPAARKRSAASVPASNVAPPAPEVEPQAVEVADAAQSVEPVASEQSVTSQRRRRKRADASVRQGEPAAPPETARPEGPVPGAAEQPAHAAPGAPAAHGRREQSAGPMFLMSYDDSPKRTLAEKIEAAMMAYQSRFARRPNLVLVNAAVSPEVSVADVAIERRSSVPPNNFWAGMQPTMPSAVTE